MLQLSLRDTLCSISKLKRIAIDTSNSIYEGKDHLGRELSVNNLFKAFVDHKLGEPFDSIYLGENDTPYGVRNRSDTTLISYLCDGNAWGSRSLDKDHSYIDKFWMRNQLDATVDNHFERYWHWWNDQNIRKPSEDKFPTRILSRLRG